MLKLFVVLSLMSMPAFAQNFSLSSKALKAGGAMANEQVFNSFGCTGANVSPDLSWKGAPKDTKAFAITVYDPDAPTGSGWWHWVAFNIPKDKTSIALGASAKAGGLGQGAIQSRTDFGSKQYGGACPPPGPKHRYIFKVYALKDKLQVDSDASGAMVGFNINQAKLAEASIEVTYQR